MKLAENQTGRKPISGPMLMAGDGGRGFGCLVGVMSP